MKKIVAVAVFLFAVAVSGTFGQTSADEWFKKAGEYFDKGDYANAVTAFSETIKRNSSNLDAFLNRGLAYYQIKNYDAAIADYDTVIKGAPNFPVVYVLRGYNYGEKGIYHKAVTDYRTGLEKGYDPSGFNVDKSSKANMWFCGAMYMEIVVNRFLGKSDVVTKYENWLKIVCDKNKVTRAEIEKFYRDNVRALIAGVVDEEFKGITVPASTVSYVKDSLVNFYLTPNQANFNVLKNIYHSTDGNLDYIQQSYDADMINLANAQRLKLTNLIEGFQNSTRRSQNILNERRRQLNAPNDAPIDWSGFRSAYYKILDDLNTELVRKM
jgi:Tfp pilus assembly protein PilF